MFFGSEKMESRKSAEKVASLVIFFWRTFPRRCLKIFESENYFEKCRLFLTGFRHEEQKKQTGKEKVCDLVDIATPKNAGLVNEISFRETLEAMLRLAYWQLLPQLEALGAPFE